jgi:predicted nucleotidyltransferase
VTPFDPKPYADNWRRRNSEEAERILCRAGEAWREAELLAGRMRSECSVERVILFGSLVLQDGPRREDFDIDLAIIGGFWECARDLADNSNFSVDLLEYEKAPEHIRKRVDEEGVLLAGG